MRVVRWLLATMSIVLIAMVGLWFW